MPTARAPAVLEVHSAPALCGSIRVPGDKSISHRGLLLGALAQGPTRVQGFLPGGDCEATRAVVAGLGVHIEELARDSLVVHGTGKGGWREPTQVLDCANSGTTMRLLAGLVAGAPFASFLVGTPQLQGRPMGRIVEPLRAMGARILGRAGGRYAPLAFDGTLLRGIRYELPVASAQVKSCLLLAGLHAEGPSEVVEPAPCRDHSERLLRAMGAPIDVAGGRIRVAPLSAPLAPLDLRVPGDISSAAFLLVAAAAVAGSELRLEGVGVNPTRTGILKALRGMGAELSQEARREAGGEPVADLVVRGGPLRATSVGGAAIPTMIDELPILAVAATQAEGETTIRDAAELRVKETDRIEVTAGELRKLGARIETRPDGMVVSGPVRLQGAAVDSHGDHRLAMALTVAGLLAEGSTRVAGADVIADSYPGFVETLQALGAQVG